MKKRIDIAPTEGLLNAHQKGMERRTWYHQNPIGANRQQQSIGELCEQLKDRYLSFGTSDEFQRKWAKRRGVR